MNSTEDRITPRGSLARIGDSVEVSTSTRVARNVDFPDMT